jgi:hypothetical protein
MKTRLVLFALAALAILVGVTAQAQNLAYRINTLVWDGPESAHGTFSSRSTSTSTSYSVTVKGALLGDDCNVVYGVAVAAANQALEETCKITAADTATVRITNASGGSITPTTGRRGVRVTGFQFIP